MPSQQDLYNELSYYTLSHTDPVFIHHPAVDAFEAQTANEQTKPITITFALMGLYLYLEKNYSGKQVQMAHMKVAQHTNIVWPTFILPAQRGVVTVADVLQGNPGEERDMLLNKWCVSVWDAYAKSHKQVADFLDRYLF